MKNKQYVPVGVLREFYPGQSDFEIDISEIRTSSTSKVDGSWCFWQREDVHNSVMYSEEPRLGIPVG